MEQIYQMAWVLVLLLVSANMTVYYLSPFYLCPNHDCPDALLQAIRPGYDPDTIRDSFGGTQSQGSQSGTASTTPPGFGDMLLGIGGIIWGALTIFWSSFAGISSIAFYYATIAGKGSVLYAITSIFTTILSVIQIIAYVFLGIYLWQVLKGSKV